jgi:chromate transporter
MDENPSSRRSTLGDLARLFLRLGATAFGGPAAHIALMEDEVVRRRRWLTREAFLDCVGAANLIPGPTSTELAIHIGHARGGWPGLLVAGTCFIVPAMLLTGLAAWAYVTYGSLPAASGVLYGVKPVVIAVVVQALLGLGRAAVKSGWLAVVGVLAAAAVTAGVHELLVLAGAAVAAVLGVTTRTRSGAAALLAGGGAVSAGATVLAAGTAATAAPFGLWSLFLVFVKIGSVLFGSGYVLLAFLRADLVERLGWLSEAQLLDAVAIGQVTPGPVFSTATFVGYLLGGPAGAGVATIGIFLPAFVFVALSGPLVPRLRRSTLAGAALDGVNAASLALMAVVSWHLGRNALVDPLTVVLAIVAAVALVRYGVNSAWLIAGGAITGWVAASWPR